MARATGCLGEISDLQMKFEDDMDRLVKAADDHKVQRVMFAGYNIIAGGGVMGWRDLVTKMVMSHSSPP